MHPNYRLNRERTIHTLLWALVTALFTSPAWAHHRVGHGGGPGGGDPGGETPVCIAAKTAGTGTVDCDPLPLQFIPGVDNNYTLVFNEEFDEDFDSCEATGVCEDASGFINYKRWSTRFPFGNWRNNTAGPEDNWNVNTTGLDPGVGFTPDNTYPDMINFINQLDINGTEIFQRDAGSLIIQAHKNPWKHRINKREDNLTGVISSHADPSQTGNPHGFEFTYGFAQIDALLPRKGNGFRAAFWLYSDNSYYNEFHGGAQPVYEIDVLEHLPNSRCPEGFVPQSDLFGNSGNSGILTYDTIYHTYHYPSGPRTPVDWHVNEENRYAAVRCAINGGNDDAVIDWGQRESVRFGVLWEPTQIRWFINGYLVEEHEYTGTDVFSGRMYLLANLAMGNLGFEGSVDDSVFDSDGGPQFEIKSIKVWQDSTVLGVTWCGLGGVACN